MLLAQKHLIDFRCQRRLPTVDGYPWQDPLHPVRADTGCHQGLGGRDLLRIQSVGGLDLFDCIRTLVEQPPSHRGGGDHHHGKSGKLKDTRGLHTVLQSMVASASCRACASRSRSELR